MYAQYIDKNTIIPAGKSVTVDGVTYTGNIPHEVYISAGYLLVVETEPPTHDPSFEVLSKEYKVQNGEIRTVWTKDTIDLEVVIENKLAEVNAACESTIHAGISVDTARGVEHFSLRYDDQINIKDWKDEIKSGLSFVPYHADDDYCRLFTAEEFLSIAKAAAIHKIYHLTYCNHLRQHIKALTDAQSVAAIHYGVALPEELQDNLDGIVATMEAVFANGGDVEL